MKSGELQAILTSLFPGGARELVSLAAAQLLGTVCCLSLAESSASECQPSAGPSGCVGQRRRMFRFSLKKWWPKKKSRREKHTAGSELQILSRETREQPKRQPQGQPLKWKESCRRLFSRFHRSEDPERTHPLITSKGTSRTLRRRPVLTLFLCASVHSFLCSFLPPSLHCLLWWHSEGWRGPGRVIRCFLPNPRGSHMLTGAGLLTTTIHQATGCAGAG